MFIRHAGGASETPPFRYLAGLRLILPFNPMITDWMVTFGATRTTSFL